MATKPTVSFVTGNPNKLKEVVQILEQGGALPVTIDNVSLDLPEHQAHTSSVELPI